MYIQHLCGREGERIAERYYRAKGYILIEKNYRCSAGELDLIFLYKSILYIVEVKTRTTGMFGFPEESVTTAKVDRMHRCAQIFIDFYAEWREHDVSFEVCSILRTISKDIITIYPC